MARLAVVRNHRFASTKLLLGKPRLSDELPTDAWHPILIGVYTAPTKLYAPPAIVSWNEDLRQSWMAVRVDHVVAEAAEGVSGRHSPAGH